MLDFESLEYSFAEEATYSFVGIQIDPNDKQKKLYLPLGFKPDDDDLDESYSKKKELFFLLYRTLRKFTSRLDKYHKREYSENNRDGTGKGSTKQTFSIETDESNEEVAYTRLSGIDDVLDGFDELRLFAMRERMRSSDEIDYSQIHRHLDKATYLSDGTIYIDQMQIPKPTLAYHTTDLVRMYCYIYCEIKRELDEGDDIGEEVQAEAENFREHHLSPADSLFDEHSHDRTRDQLCEQLERINEQTAFKDDAFWHFYEAIEAVLYPQNRKKNDDGIYWGIDNFCFVWEDMCHDYNSKNELFETLYADRLVHNNHEDDIQDIMKMESSNQSTQIKPDRITALSSNWLKEVTITREVIEFESTKWNFQLNTLDRQKKNILTVQKTGMYKDLSTVSGTQDGGPYRIDKIHKGFFNSDDMKENKLKYPYQEIFFEMHRTGELCNVYQVIDYKYKKKDDIDNIDVQKQLVYEYAIRKNKENSSVQNIFIIPGSKNANEINNDGIWRCTYNSIDIVEAYAGIHDGDI